jgi:hypothetical protein
MYVFQLPNGRLISTLTPDHSGWSFTQRSFTTLNLKNGQKAGGRISNDGTSYRAAQSSRTISCGLARLPSICHSETYQVYAPNNKIRSFPWNLSPSAPKVL